MTFCHVTVTIIRTNKSSPVRQILRYCAAMELVAFPYHHRMAPPDFPPHKTGKLVGFPLRFRNVRMRKAVYLGTILAEKSRARTLTTVEAVSGGGAPLPPLDLTEDNIHLVLSEARVEVSFFSSSFCLANSRLVRERFRTGLHYRYST